MSDIYDDEEMLGDYWSILDQRHGHDPYECEYEHCPTCRQHWMDEKADQLTRKED